jgi:hypothetical protein
MIFIVRANDRWRESWPPDARARIVLVRQTPSIVASEPGQTDLFCVGEEAEADRLGERGWSVVRLHDGWYADDGEGGVAVWGQGAYWEVRDTPFSVKDAVGPAGEAAGEGEDSETLDVRKGIFGT